MGDLVQEVMAEVWDVFVAASSSRVRSQCHDVYSAVGWASIVEVDEYDMSAVAGGVTDVSE